MKFSRPAQLFCALAALQKVNALRLGLRGQALIPTAPLHRRSHLSGLLDSQNVQYSTNLTLNGQLISAIVDTGSSDLYATANINGANDTGQIATLVYGDGPVEGPIKTASLQFDGFSIPDQAYLETPPSNSNEEGTGLIGLGPYSASTIYDILKQDPSGYPPLERIFRQDPSTPNYITVLLGRSDDPDEMFPGDLTVSELIPGYENVTNQPKLPSINNGHWSTFLDGISVNGQIIELPKSQVANSGKQLTVVFDTGFSLPQLPRPIVDAIYGGVKGAQFSNDPSLGGIYTLPCDQEIDLIFFFGGQPYLVHPLDTNMQQSDLDDNGDSTCMGPFQPFSFDASFGSGQAPPFDIILGMAFLRNAYLYVNMGDSPYLQLLSITNDTAKANQDFVQVRGSTGELDESATQTPVPPSEQTQSFSKGAKIGIAVGASVLLIMLVAAFILWCCIRNRRKHSANISAAYPDTSYQPLNAPAPDAAAEMHSEYNPQSVPRAPYNYQPYAPTQPYDLPPSLLAGYRTPYDKQY